MHDDDTIDNNQRRRFVTHAAMGTAALVASMTPGLRASVWAAGSDAPEKKEVKVGFIPLTDCASVVMASVKGFDKKYGITITPSKEASWAAVRDKLVNGELDASHVLYGLIYGVQMGIGGPKKDMAFLMNLNHNGQAITLSSQLREKGAVDGESLAKLIAREKREYTFAQTFPTGTHAMWIYYWLAAHGINPMKDVKTITVPPPQMVANMRVGNMDGFCVGEPWGARAIADKIGFTSITTQGLWKDHPEKTLGTTLEFVQKHPNTARAMTAAILEAGKWIDASPANRKETAEVIGAKSYVNCEPEIILGRFLGHYENGIGKSWEDPDYMKFSGDGYVNFPVSVRRHVVHDAAPPLGAAEGRPRLPRRGEQSEPDRDVQAGRIDGEGVAAEERDALRQADGRRDLGRQGSGEVRGRLQGQGGMSAMSARVVAHPSALRARVIPAQVSTVIPAQAGIQRPERSVASRTQAPQWLVRIFAMALGLAVFVALWGFIAKFGRIPDPLAVSKEAVRLFSDPFYRNGPNDQGIGWNVLQSLGRVGIGFGLAAAVGIPMGFMIGRFRFLADMAAPIIALLKPVSPLAWLPIGLLVFKAANPASIWVIFICSLWPMVVNTAAGVRQIPADYLNVARVLNLSDGRCSRASCCRPCCRTC
jgi:nitrate/nitrite transport system substrate-binding protein